MLFSGNKTLPAPGTQRSNGCMTELQTQELRLHISMIHRINCMVDEDRPPALNWLLLALQVIVNTVRQLSPADAAVFLRAAVARLHTRPSRSHQLATWLRAVLLHHTAYLISAGGAQRDLAGLYRTIQARLAGMAPLMSLSGRLDVLLAQVPRSADGAAQAEFSAPRVGFQGLQGLVRVTKYHGLQLHAGARCQNPVHAAALLLCLSCRRFLGFSAD